MKIKLTLRFAFWLYLFLAGLKSFSQDVIILKNGDEIQSIVMEVAIDIIKYKKWDNQDGPIYSSNKADVFMIKYQNGTKDVFNTSQSQTNLKPNDNSSKIVGIAKPFMEKQIFSESRRACKLVEFYKQNGVEKDIFGQKIYTLEYRLIIELQKKIWKSSKDKWLGADWYWTNFSVLDKKGDVYAQQFTHNYIHFTKGTRIEITGVIDFEKTDNGWRMKGVNMFSQGYKNKTSKVLPNVVKATSKIRKRGTQEFVYKKKLNKHVFKPEKGELESQYSFDNIEYLTSGTWLVLNDGLWGVFNKENKLVLPIKFEKIDFYTKNSNLVKLDGIWGNYLDSEFKPITEEIVFRNPDQITHLKKCYTNEGTNKTFDDCLLKEIYLNFRYPKEAIEKEIEGMMVAELIIDSKGNITSTQILRGLKGGLTDELIRLIKDNLNDWKPAINEGKTVNSRKIILVRVKLKG